MGLLAVSVMSAGVIATGCGPATKQAAVRQIDQAVKGLGVRTGSLSLTIEPGPGAPKSQSSSLAAVAANTSLPAKAGLIIDPATAAAALLAPAQLTSKAGGPVLTLFDRSSIYSRTADGGVVGARPWFELDTSHLGALNHYTEQDLENPATLGDLVVMNPLTLIDQSYGFLTGSVKVDRNVTVTLPGSAAPAPAVEYSGNTSLDKVARQLHLDPDREKPTRNLLGLFASRRDINPVSIWLSPAGALLRIRLTYISKPLKRVEFKVVYDLTLDAPGTTTPDLAALDPPSNDQVVGVRDLGELSLALQKIGQQKGSA
jgi:hypothetical protein